MIIFKIKQALKKHLHKNRINQKSIGFVPTMGALHEGHLSLIKASKKANDFTVCSIFVNPTQFNNKKDFNLYPTPVDKDILLLLNATIDILFIPTVKEMYPTGHKLKHFELGALENNLEGAYRPGHYQGVCQIVAKLLETIEPNNLYLGQKDYQQCMVINKLITLEDFKTKVKICNTIREPNGLAMSSRNMRLTNAEKTKAGLIYETLLHIKKNIKAGDLNKLITDSIKKLTQQQFKVDYVAIADAQTLTAVKNWDGKQKLVALVAATINEVRLIDNLPLN